MPKKKKKKKCPEWEGLGEDAQGYVFSLVTICREKTTQGSCCSNQGREESLPRVLCAACCTGRAGGICLGTYEPRSVQGTFPPSQQPVSSLITPSSWDRLVEVEKLGRKWHCWVTRRSASKDCFFHYTTSLVTPQKHCFCEYLRSPVTTGGRITPHIPGPPSFLQQQDTQRACSSSPHYFKALLGNQL